MFIKSSYSCDQIEGPDCVELEREGAFIRFRDSKHPDGPILMFHWRAVQEHFAQIRSGVEVSCGGALRYWPEGEEWVMTNSQPDAPQLRFTPDEWKAYCRGVEQAEFDQLVALAAKAGDVVPAAV